MTVDFRVFGVTHSGCSSTDGTDFFSWMSSVVPLSSDDGGVLPARR